MENWILENQFKTFNSPFYHIKGLVLVGLMLSVVSTVNVQIFDDLI